MEQKRVEGKQKFKKEGGKLGQREEEAATPLWTMIQFLQSSEPNLQSHNKILHNKILEKKHTDQESRNKEVIEGIPERDLRDFR